MKIYNYDPEGIFIDVSEADPDPETPGEFLIPARATTTPPPETGPKQAAVWRGGEWHVLPDLRGEAMYSTEGGSEKIVDFVGPVPAAYTFAPRPGPAYVWAGDKWVYKIELDSPGAGYAFDPENQRWVKTRFTRKEFLFLCGVPKVAALNAGANTNPTLAAVHDILMAAEFIDVTDADTIQLVGFLSTPEGGNIFTAEDAARILAGVPHAAAA